MIRMIRIAGMIFVVGCAAAVAQAPSSGPGTAIVLSDLDADTAKAFPWLLAGCLASGPEAASPAIFVHLPAAGDGAPSEDRSSAVSLLYRLGFRNGDRLLSVNKQEVPTLRDVQHALAARVEGTPHLITIDRKGQESVRLVLRVVEQSVPEPVSDPVTGVISVDGAKLEEEYGDLEPLELIAEVQPRFWRSPDGAFLGVTSDRFSAFPVAEQIGLRNGDIVYSVNGVTIQSEGELLTIGDRIGNPSQVSIGVLRDGEPMTITVQVK